MGNSMDRKALEPGNEIYNTETGEVMTYVCKSFIFDWSRPLSIYAYGYDDYKRIVEWPYNQSERV